MSYVGNVFKSFKFALPKIAAQQLGNLTDFAKVVDYNESDEMKGVLTDAKSFIKKDIKTPLKTILKDIDKGIKTGNFYQEESDDDFGGMGMDMSSFEGMDFSEEPSISSTEVSDDMFGGDDDGDLFGEGDTTNNVQNITKQSFVNNVTQSTGGNASKQAALTGSLITTSAIAATGKHTTSAIVHATQGLLDSNRFLLDQTVAFHHESGRFFERNVGTLSEIGEILGGMLDTQNKTNAFYGIKEDDSVDDIFAADKSVFNSDGKLNGANYVESLLTKAKDQTALFRMQLDSMQGEGAAREFIAGETSERLLNTSMFKSISNLNKTIGEVPTLFFDKLRDSETSDNPLIAGISKFLGVKEESTVVNFSEYEKGPVPFDGITRRAIVDVIPNFLGQILNELKGGKAGDQAIYDYETGKFSTQAKIMKENEDSLRTSASVNFGKSPEAIKQGLDFGGDFDAESKFDDLTNKVLLELSRSSKVLREDSNISDIIGSELGGSQNAQLIKSRFDSMSATEKMEFHKGRRLTRTDIRDQNESIKNTQNSAVFAAMESDKRQRDDIMTARQVELNGGTAAVGKRPIVENATAHLSEGNAGVDAVNAGGVLENADGTTTLGSIAKSPLKAVSKITDSINSSIGKFFFGGSGEADPEASKGVFAKVDSSLGKMFFGRDGEDFDGSFFSVMSTNIAKWSSALLKDMKGTLGSLHEYINTKLLAPMITKVGSVIGNITSPISDFFNGTDKKQGFISKVEDQVSGLVKSASENIFKPMKKSLFGEDGKGGMFGSLKDVFFGDKNKDSSTFGGLGFVGSMNKSFTDDLFNPLKATLFGSDDESTAFKGRGLFGSLKDQFSDKLLTPAKSFLFGDKNASEDASEVSKLGVLGFFKDRMSTQILNPMKSYLFGDSENPESVGLFKRIGNSIAGAFNFKKGDGAGFMESLSLKISDKFIKPISNYLSNPDTGLFARMGNKFGEVLSPIREKLLGDGSDENSGVLGVISKKFDSVTKSFNAFLFGDAESGKVGLMGKAESWFTDTIANPFKGFMFGEDGESGAWGDLKGGFNSFMYGDDDGKEGFFSRIIQPTMNFVDEQIVNPFKDSIAESWTQAKDFVREEVFKPLKGTLEPFISELGLQFDKLKEFVFTDLKESIIGSFGMMNSQLEQTLGVNVGEVMKKNVLDPIKDTLSKVKDGIGKALGAIVKFPVNVLKGMGDDLKTKHLLEGKGGYIDPAEKARLLDKYNKGRSGKDKVKTFGSQAAVKKSAVSKATKTSKTDDIVNKDAIVVQDKANSDKEGFFSRLFGGGNAAGFAANPKNASQVSAVSKTSKSSQVSNVNASNKANAVASSDTTSKDSTVNSIAKDRKSSVAKKVATPQSVMEKVATKVNGIKNDTGKLYSFVKSNLQGVGHNIHKLAKKLAPNDVSIKGAENQERKSLKGKLFDIIKSPFKLLGSFAKNAMESATNAVKSIAGAAVDIVKAPFILAGKALKGVGKAASLATKMLIPLAKGVGKLAKGMLNVVGDIAKGVGSVTKKVFEAASVATVEAGKGLAKATSSIGKFIFKSVLPAMGKLVKGMGKLAWGMLKLTASVVGSLAKGAARGVGRVLGLGGGSGNASSSLKRVKSVTRIAGGMLDSIKDTINVHVVGGKLDSIGAKGLAKSKGKSATAQLAEGVAKKEAANDSNFRTKLVGNTSETSGHLGKLRKSFSGFGPMILTGLAVAFAGLKTFFMGKLVTPLMGFLSRILASNMMKGLGSMGKKGIGKAGSMLKNGAKGAASMGGRAIGALKNVKGVGPAMIAGLAGAGINYAADEYMDEGIGKETVKTGGSALAYGATGAMIGSIIPGLGTAVGGAIGAGVGAVVENWDHITKAVGSSMFGKEAKYDKDGNLVAMKTNGIINGVSSHLFGNDAELDANGNVIRMGKDSFLTRLGNAFVGSDDEVTSDGQLLKKGVKSPLQKLSYAVGSSIQWLFGDKNNDGIFTRAGNWFGSTIDSVSSTLSGWGDSIVDTWNDSNIIGDMIDGAGNMFSNIGDNISSFFKHPIDSIVSTWNSFNPIDDAIASMKEMFGTAADHILSFFSDLNPITALKEWWNSDDGDDRSFSQKLIDYGTVDKVTKSSAAENANKKKEEEQDTISAIRKRKNLALGVVRNAIFDKAIENGIVDTSARIISISKSGDSITSMRLKTSNGDMIAVDQNGKVIEAANRSPSVVKMRTPAIEAIDKAAVLRDSLADSNKNVTRQHSESVSMLAMIGDKLSIIADHTGEFKNKELSVNIEQQNSIETDGKADKKTVVVNSSTNLFSGEMSSRGANAQPRSAANGSAQRIAKGN